MEERDIQSKGWKWTAIALIVLIVLFAGYKGVTYTQTRIAKYIETEVAQQVEAAKIETFSNGIALGKAYAYNETMDYLQNAREDLEQQYREDESYPKWYAVAKSRELIETYHNNYLGDIKSTELFDKKLEEYVSKPFDASRYRAQLSSLTQEERTELWSALQNDDYDTLYKLYYKMDGAGSDSELDSGNETTSTFYEEWRWVLSNYFS